MAVSQAQKLAVQKYRAKTYDTIGFDVPKGKRDEYKEKASKLGLSLAKFLFLSAESYGEEFTPAPRVESEKLTAEQRRLLDEFGKLPVDAQKYFMKAFKAINEQAKGGGENGDN